MKGRKIINRFMRRTFKYIVKNKRFDFFWNIIGTIVTENNDLFTFWEKYGFHITKDHYYEPIPDSRTLNERLWEDLSILNGLDMNENFQYSLLLEFEKKFKTEYDKIPNKKTFNPFQYYIPNGSFDSVDGEILYCMIRYYKPKLMIEVGSGLSTLCSTQALLVNNNENDFNANFYAIEPYPYDFLKRGVPGLTDLIIEKLENIPLEFFKKLNENDILFIDSSHILKIGSDVHYLFLNILPILNKGVIVHFHDIFIPSEYPKNWILKDHRFYNEQYLLQAFLTFNDTYKVIWAGSYMLLNRLDDLKRAFNTCKKGVWPGSFWIRKIK